MPDAPAILTEVLDGGVALIRLNRPEVLNALSSRLAVEMAAHRTRERACAPFGKNALRSFIDKAPPGVSALWQEAMDMIAERPNQS